MIIDELIKSDKYTFDVSYISDIGGRNVNEDSVVVKYEDGRLLLCVADGLGAHGGGDVASKIACEVAGKEYMKISRPTRRSVLEIFRRIDSAIVENQTDDLKMKTTLASVMCKGKKFYAAHLGDTRIYVFKNADSMYLTADHSVAFEEMVSNRGTLGDIRLSPSRHILRAALGGGAHRPDTFSRRMKNNMAVLICSDGFWEYVCEDEMMDTLQKSSGTHEWLESMLEIFNSHTDENNDNYSAVCLRISANGKIENKD